MQPMTPWSTNCRNKCNTFEKCFISEGKTTSSQSCSSWSKKTTHWSQIWAKSRDCCWRIKWWRCRSKGSRLTHLQDLWGMGLRSALIIRLSSGDLRMRWRRGKIWVNILSGVLYAINHLLVSITKRLLRWRMIKLRWGRCHSLWISFGAILAWRKCRLGKSCRISSTKNRWALRYMSLKKRKRKELMLIVWRKSSGIKTPEIWPLPIIRMCSILSIWAQMCLYHWIL